MMILITAKSSSAHLCYTKGKPISSCYTTSSLNWNKEANLVCVIISPILHIILNQTFAGVPELSILSFCKRKQ